MAKTDEQRGPRAAWLRRHRIAKYGTGDGGLASLSAALKKRGLDRSPTTIKGWESSDDRSPVPADVLPDLEALFGDPAPGPAGPDVTAEALLGVMRAQTEAITELVKELRLARERDQDAAAAMIRAAEALLQARRPEGAGASTEPDAPLVTTQ